MRNLRQVFYDLCKRGNWSEITLPLFEKLYNKPIVSNTCIQRIDMTLAYQAATFGTSGGDKPIKFLNFMHLMLKFYELKVVNEAGLDISFE